MSSPVKFVARKTVTYVQEGSVYKDRFVLPFEPDYGSTVREVFLDSAGAQIGADVVGEIDGRYIQFRVPYGEVEQVPNAANFYIYLHLAGEDAGDEDLAFYGSVFRRQHVFPDSPALSASTVVHEFEDSFQRPAGAVGGRWKVLIGRPVIFDNGANPNTVGPSYPFFSRYFMYYYQPFNADAVELSISARDKGDGTTIVTLCQNSSATSYLYVGFNSQANTVTLGYGDGPDIGTGSGSGVLEPQITPVALTVPNPALGTYKIIYDDITNKLSLFNETGTTLIASWTDSGNIVPHGKGYRYFGVAGNAGFLNSGVEIAYIRAHGIV